MTGRHPGEPHGEPQPAAPSRDPLAPHAPAPYGAEPSPHAATDVPTTYGAEHAETDLPVSYGAGRHRPAGSMVPRGRDVWFSTARLTGWLILAGLPVGLLWVLVAPQPLVTVGEDRVSGTLTGNTGAFIAADGYLLAFGLLVGAVAGILGFRAARRHGPLPVLGVCVGSAAGSFVAAGLGHWLSQQLVRASLDEAQPGDIVEAALQVQAWAVVAGWPLAAVLTILTLTFALWPREPRHPDGSTRPWR